MALRVIEEDGDISLWIRERKSGDVFEVDVDDFEGTTATFKFTDKTLATELFDKLVYLDKEFSFSIA